MKEFMMIFRTEKTEGGAQPSAEQMQAMLNQWQTWIKSIVSKGKYSGTNRLLPDGKIVKPNNIVTDGPYAEAKEMVGGYLIVKASSLDEAVQLAKSCPAIAYGRNVEVRPVMPIEYDANSKDFLAQKEVKAYV